MILLAYKWPSNLTTAQTILSYPESKELHQSWKFRKFVLLWTDNSLVDPLVARLYVKRNVFAFIILHTDMHMCEMQRSLSCRSQNRFPDRSKR